MSELSLDEETIVVNTNKSVVINEPDIDKPKKCTIAKKCTTTKKCSKDYPEDITCVKSKDGSQVLCQYNRPPWPTIIIAGIGAGLLMYTAVGQGIPQDRRIFGIVMILLWTLLWALLAWVLWRECHVAGAWWLLIIGVAILVLFFVIVIALNLGG